MCNRLYIFAMDNLSCKECPTETTGYGSSVESTSTKQQTDSSAEYKAMKSCHDKLVKALSNGVLSISQKLFANGIISEETSEKMLLTSATQQEKATILVNNIRKMIEINPTNFSQFISILSEEQCTKDIVKILQSTLRDIIQNTHPHPLAKCVEGNEHALPAQFIHYLKTLYTSLTPAQLSDDQWPPSATRRVFNLAMIKTTEVRRGQIEDEYVRQTITGKMDDILYEKEPIELKDILQKSEQKRKVVLLEGAPGCGKSTLSVFIAQQWGEGKLFTEYQLVILIRLRDPAVQEAKCIADLIPSPDSSTAQEIETKILANNCRDVLFILDGWDELPSNLKQNSLFHHFIKPNLLQRNPVHESAVIITSRPIASCDLHQFISTRVEILGFTPKELDEYFFECLKGDMNNLQLLKERIDLNPAVASSCYLPLNANILVHLFLSLSNTLPTTQFEIFSQFILHCIYRHQIKFTESKDPLESLEDLPEGIREPFQFLCELAYKGIMDNRVVFSSKDVPNKSNLLGLIQGVESLAKGKVVSYHFLHLSVQELLAALHIAKNMSESEQVSLFDQFFLQHRFIPVFRFYAAITNLKLSGISDVIVKHCHWKIDILLIILNCLCEAQNPPQSLYLSVARFIYSLRVPRLTNGISDCFSIGCFLSCICKNATDDNQFEVDFTHNCIGDQGFKYLVKGLHRCLDKDSAVTTLLTMHIRANNITRGACHLPSLLKLGCVEHLDFSNEPWDTNWNKLLLQDSFTEQLKCNTTLKCLHLRRCGIIPVSIKYLAEALITNKHLEELDISDNLVCDEGIQYLAPALQINRGLLRLDMKCNGITSHSVKSLAAALTANNYLQELDVSYNFLGDDGVQHLKCTIKGLKTELILKDCLSPYTGWGEMFLYCKIVPSSDINKEDEIKETISD